MKHSRYFITLGLALLGALGMLSFGCGEKDVPFVSDNDYMLQYLDKTDDGRELFRWQNLIIPKTYEPHSGVFYRDSLVTHTRTPIFDTILQADFGVPYGVLSYCNFTITDVFTVRTRKIDGLDTTYFDADRRLIRMGKFVKLGNDYQPFLGWSLWSYAGRNVIGVKLDDPAIGVPGGTLTVIPQTDLTRLPSISTFAKGAAIIVRTGNPTTILSAETDSGFVQSEMWAHNSAGPYYDTLQTASGNTRLWNVMLFQVFREQDMFFLGAYCVPYRVPQ